MKGFLDIETGGFSITKNGVCEIALIAVNKQNEIVDTFHEFIKPYTREESSEELVSYKEDAMAINGIKIENLITEGTEVGLVVNRLITFIKKNDIEIIIGHNSNLFDIPRIEYLLNRFAGYSIANFNKEDTMHIAKSILNLPVFKLKYLCEYFGITNIKEHSALGDALATFELYNKLMAK
jgi:DNA polymerase III epsilon subunit-like protein